LMMVAFPTLVTTPPRSGNKKACAKR
jgi:hypothetical protein